MVLDFSENQNESDIARVTKQNNFFGKQKMSTSPKAHTETKKETKQPEQKIVNL